MNRKFVIFHPSDFSTASQVAFAHALKIALQAKAKLDIMHVETHLSPDKPYWLDFPAVRATLTRWGVLPEGARRDEVSKTGLHIRKILKSGTNPLETMMRHFRGFPPDLIVLATHQREGIDRWLHKAVAEPLARRSGAMTLFVPRRGKGFVSMKDGAVKLKKFSSRSITDLIRKPRSPRLCFWREASVALRENFGCFTWALPEQRPWLNRPRRPDGRVLCS